jgi:hypothetical protein
MKVPPGLIRTGLSRGEMVDTHVAHYEGWTIAVVCDARDLTWMAQAVPYAYSTIDEYIEAVRHHPEEIVYASTFYTTKEAVLADIVACIDQVNRCN